MPIYEFFCPQTDKIYSFYARNLSLSGQTPTCPDNPIYLMERRLSSFSVTERRKSAAESTLSLGPSGTPTRMIAEIGKSLDAMSDPERPASHFAQFMRKVWTLTGDRLPTPIGEVLGRMEAGENSERLNAEYDTAFSELDSQEAKDLNTEDGSARKVRRHSPARDPLLYEMADYLKSESRAELNDQAGHEYMI